MKTTTSFNLEENTLKEIMEYKDKYNLSSRNMALEMMLNERKTMFRIFENISLSKDSTNIDSEMNIGIKNELDMVKSSIVDSFNSMPD